MVDELRLPIPEGFVVSKAGPEGLTTVMAESPGSPFEVFFRLTPPQVDQISASKRAEELRPKENEAPPDEDDELIALSWRGTQNLRAVEVVVQTPRSCRVEAERLGASLVAAVR